MSLAGIDYLETIEGIKGDVKFNESGLSSDNISAKIFGIPVKADVYLPDFSSPLLTIDITSRVDLETVQDILKEKFEIILPADVQVRGIYILRQNMRCRKSVPLK